MEKKPYLDAAAKFAGTQGEALHVHHVGDMMYREGAGYSSRNGRLLP